GSGGLIVIRSVPLGPSARRSTTQHCLPLRPPQIWSRHYTSLIFPANNGRGLSRHYNWYNDRTTMFELVVGHRKERAAFAGIGSEKMTKIALLGAGGKMGVRLSKNLQGSRFDVAHVEVSPEGQARLLDEVGVA